MGYGDEIMASGEVKKLKELYPNAQILLKYSGPHVREIFKNNPDLTLSKNLDKKKEYKYVEGKWGARPYHLNPQNSRKCTGKKVYYDSSYKAIPGSIYFSEKEKEYISKLSEKYKNYIMVVSHSKTSFTPNKNWNIGSSKDKWQELIYELKEFNLIQVGPNLQEAKEGISFVETNSFRKAMCLLAACRGIVTTEGGLHHAAAALGKPGVVIFGGWTPPEITGYDLHTNLYIKEGSPCGNRRVCSHCKKCMALISINMVAKEIRKIFSI